MVKTTNKYSNKKIVWFPEKLNSFKDGRITPPIYVRIKPINKCCHSCSFCIYRAKNVHMHETMNESDMLPKDKLFEVLDDLKDMGTKCVTYSGGGEPLMHPNIAEAMQRTLDNGLDLSLLTNAQLLNGKRAEVLSKAKWIRISMDYYDAESFVKSRGGNEKMFDQIISNIIEFNKIKNDVCELSVNYIITKENVDNIHEMTKLLKEIGINNIRYFPVQVDNYVEYHRNITKEVSYILECTKKFYENSEFKIYDGYKIEPESFKRPYNRCYIMQTIPVIGADSFVYNCHNKAYSTDGIIGSIKNQSFKQLWFSEETKKHFDKFNPQICCKCFCANDNKNIFIHELLNAYGDNFV